MHTGFYLQAKNLLLCLFGVSTRRRANECRPGRAYAEDGKVSEFVLRVIEMKSSNPKSTNPLTQPAGEDPEAAQRIILSGSISIFIYLLFQSRRVSRIILDNHASL